MAEFFIRRPIVAMVIVDPDRAGRGFDRPCWRLPISSSIRS
jgi:hypothetical protein